jgi:hypothetical protein
MEESKDLAPLGEETAPAKTPIVAAPEIKTPGKVTSAADSDGLEAVPGPSGGGLGPATGAGSALGRPIARRRPPPRKRPNPWGWVFVVLLAIAAGVGTFLYIRSTQTNPAFVGSTTAVSSRLPVSIAISANGQVQANADLSVSFSSGGTLTKLNKKLGDTVQAGEALAQIDDSDLQFALQSAQSSYDQAQATYQTAIAGATQSQLDVAQMPLEPVTIKPSTERQPLKILPAPTLPSPAPTARLPPLTQILKAPPLNWPRTGPVAAPPI